jgi:inosine/xanthosine triphosphatase
LIVLVGSTRAAKVEGARAALAAVAALDARFAGPHVHTCDLTAVAPRMPMSEGEIIAGAHRRAQALVTHEKFAAGESFAVGLEGGLGTIDVPGGRQWTLQTWAAVTDGAAWGYGAGGAILVPETLARRVIAGEELGDVIDALAGAPTRGTRGAWGVLTRDLVGRRDAYRLAVVAAFAPFYNRAIWTWSGPRTADGSR